LEQSILGAALSDVRVLTKLVGLNVAEEDFYLEKNRIVWRCMKSLYDANIAVDVMTVSEQLHTHIGNEKWSGASGSGISGDMIQLLHSADDVRIAYNIPLHAETLRNYRIKRDIATLAANTLQTIGAHDFNAAEALQTLEADVFSVSSLRFRRAQPTMRETMNSAMKLVEKRYKGEFNGVKTGIKSLDIRLDGGLENGRLYVIGARPGVGKSTFAGQIAHNVAVQQRQHVVIATYEMTKEQYALRLATNMAREDWRNLTAPGLERISVVMEELANTGMTIMDDSTMTPLELRSQMETLKNVQGAALLIVDYIQFMPPNVKNARKDIEIGDIARSLKNIAKKCDIPVVAISSFNRDLERRSNKRPQMSDFKESGDIESDADVIIGLWQNEEFPNTLDASILKNRDGIIDDVRLVHEGEFYTVRAIDHDWAEANHSF
jgi:replicative DNA helicase